MLTSQNANAVIGTVLSRVVRLRLGKTESAEYSERAVETVKALSGAVCSPYEYEKVRATGMLEGNKALTVEVLELLIGVLRDSIALKSGGEALILSTKAEALALSEKKSLKNLLDMYDNVSDIYQSLENNPNYTLLNAVLCARLG